ncbi:MAG: diguanylate cyclase [Alphaproteobacteria bacterium]|nr:diguanylate cyclase [Alphaproteobacteria bacterium]
MGTLDIEHTRAICAKALGMMEAYGVGPAPRNYEIWYAHATGTVPGLAMALEAVFTGDGEWSSQAADDIYLRFFPAVPNPASLAAIGDALQHEMASILKSVTEAGAETKSYGAALEIVTGQMDRGVDANRLPAIAHQLAVSTRAMRARTDALERELEQTSKEVAALRAKNEAIRQEALTDSLTNLGNRKHFDERLAEAADAAMKTGGPLCVIMADVDRFKAFNDMWGHQTGDQVLRLVAACFSDNVKGRDTAARYGGEEFAVILPETSLANARVLAEQIRRNVQAKKVVKRSTGETLGAITISLGVASLQPGEHPQDMLRRADKCLYAAKHAGRNRVMDEDSAGQPSATAA